MSERTRERQRERSRNERVKGVKCARVRACVCDRQEAPMHRDGSLRYIRILVDVRGVRREREER